MKYHKNYVKTFGNYEYRSLMHYSSKAFSKNGKDTIVPLEPLGKGQSMGQKKGMTKEAAEAEYIELVEKLKGSYGMKWADA